VTSISGQQFSVFLQTDTQTHVHKHTQTNATKTIPGSTAWLVHSRLLLAKHNQIVYPTSFSVNVAHSSKTILSFREISDLPPFNYK